MLIRLLTTSLFFPSLSPLSAVSIIVCHPQLLVPRMSYFPLVLGDVRTHFRDMSQ